MRTIAQEKTVLTFDVEIERVFSQWRTIFCVRSMYVESLQAYISFLFSKSVAKKETKSAMYHRLLTRVKVVYHIDFAKS